MSSIILKRALQRSSLASIRALSTQTHVVPDLKGLEKRWAKMKELDQADAIDYLAAKTQGDWHQLSDLEKRSLYYIYYGNWGPRASNPAKGISAIVLQGLFGGVLTIALGVGLMNYAFDYEREQQADTLLQRIEQEKK